jgi:transposase
MSYERGVDYSRQWLFPPSLEDLLAADHPARMIREFVDAQDLEKLGFKKRENEMGRPYYSVNLLLKVWLYGYVTGNRSMRQMERACMDQIGMLWLTGLQSPDHTTLWRFWSENRKALRGVFKRLLEVAMSMKLVGLCMHALDGTKIMSQASDQKAWFRTTLENKQKQLDEAIEEIMRQTANEPSGEDGGCRLPAELAERQQLREKVQEQLRQLDQQGRDHLQPKDPDARVMKSQKEKKFAYNAQVVVDGESKFIVAAEVVTDESDNYQLTPMLDQVKQNLGQTAEQNVTDAGYFVTTELAAAEEKGYAVLMNLPESVHAGEEKPYHASHFVYDSKNDQCICPRGEALKFQTTKVKHKSRPYTVRVYRCQSYKTCPVRWQCSSNKKGRAVQIHPHHDALVRQRQKQGDATMRALLRQRGATVEPVFGWVKESMKVRRWTVRGLEKVQTQWILLCMAMNFRRLHPKWVAGQAKFA